jgi:membrane fusion protein (multidrug efflux system)
VSDAAFIRSDTLTNLSFKVGGKVIELTKKEGDSVKAGELLASIDPKDLLVAKAKIEKRIEALKAKISAMEVKKQKLAEDVKLNERMSEINKKSFALGIAALSEEIEALEAKLAKLVKDEKRFKRLLAQKLIAKSQYEEIAAQREYVAKKVAALKSQLAAKRKELQKVRLAVELAKNARKNIRELELSIASAKKELEASMKSLEDIQNKISYTKLFAPYSGAIAKRYVGLDTIVKKGSPIYAMVDPKKLHVEVLLSEKKLKGVKRGNSVTIKVDAYPDRTYKGEVEKILPASAATFALVPRDIASGEFTKLDQRFVVRIKLFNPTPDLRVGMGASVAISRN